MCKLYIIEWPPGEVHAQDQLCNQFKRSRTTSVAAIYKSTKLPINSDDNLILADTGYLLQHQLSANERLDYTRNLSLNLELRREQQLLTPKRRKLYETKSNPITLAVTGSLSKVYSSIGTAVLIKRTNADHRNQQLWFRTQFTRRNPVAYPVTQRFLRTAISLIQFTSYNRQGTVEQ